ncbi:MAG TPA: serine hydrolase domain-containing protein, partial [Thermoanaerobaculia bacterium]|nr:serine hydrolase domain-containing protein [Thermoanaerobaculia bacterium]
MRGTGGAERLDGEVRAGLRQDNLPGVALAVAAGGRVVLDACWGQADLARGEALTPGHLLRASSLTKLVTAVVAFQLAERGRLRLDDPLVRHLPQAAAIVDPFDGPPITLRHLLTHHSGLPRGPYRRPAEAVDLLDELPLLRQVHPAGERAKYSNLGYGVLARALQAAAGRPFAELVRDGVLAPAGMAASRLEGETGIAAATRAEGGSTGAAGAVAPG